MNRKEAEFILSRCDSYQRLPRLFEIKKYLWPPTWLRLLGENWTLCDSIWRYADRILFEKPIANIDGPVWEMMTNEEREKLEAMPDQLTIFRSCYEGLNEDGISYSLNERVARVHTNLVGYRIPGKQRILRRAIVDKSSIIAYKNDRDEQEIIIRECEIIRDELI